MLVHWAVAKKEILKVAMMAAKKASKLGHHLVDPLGFLRVCTKAEM